jgi:hypothetical protein
MQSDVFEVAVTLTLRNGLILMPQEIYDCRAAVAFAIPQLQVDLRNHDYFMGWSLPLVIRLRPTLIAFLSHYAEMSLNIDPFRILETSDCAALTKLDFASLLEQVDSIRVQGGLSPWSTSSKAKAESPLFYAGLEVTANRLFGPQPRTATYVCIWSFYLGAIVGSIPPSFLQAFSRVGTSVGLNFADQDNSLPPDFSVALDPDATFLTVDLSSIDLAIRGQGTAIQLALPEGVTIRFDDLASAPFLKHIAIDIPTLTLRALAPLFGRAAPWMEVASVDADFSLVLGLSATGWEERAKTQLSFLALQDAPTRRCSFIYGQGSGGEVRSSCVAGVAKSWSLPSVSSHVGGLFLPALAAPSRLDEKNTASASGGASAARSSARDQYVVHHAGYRESLNLGFLCSGRKRLAARFSNTSLSDDESEASDDGAGDNSDTSEGASSIDLAHVPSLILPLRRRLPIALSKASRSHGRWGSI